MAKERNLKMLVEMVAVNEDDTLVIASKEYKVTDEVGFQEICGLLFINDVLGFALMLPPDSIHRITVWDPTQGPDD